MLLSFNNLVCQNSYKLASLKYSVEVVTGTQILHH